MMEKCRSNVVAFYIIYENIKPLEYYITSFSTFRIFTAGNAIIIFRKKTEIEYDHLIGTS